jgi:hypothetical protein
VRAVLDRIGEVSLAGGDNSVYGWRGATATVETRAEAAIRRSIGVPAQLDYRMPDNQCMTLSTNCVLCGASGLLKP